MYDKTHLTPYDRGSADSYYRRSPEPHYYSGNTRIEESDMTPNQIEAYYAGYEENDDYKEYM